MNSNSISLQREAANFIVKVLIKNGFEAFFAGGFVRDLILGISEKGDIDIATNAKPETITSLFPDTIGVGEQFGVMIIVQRGIPFEVATFRSDIGIHDGRHPVGVVFTDAKTDALRRDFTINGMFYNPQTEEIIDFVSGKSDCKTGIIRAIGDPQHRFKEDYLRILRAIRFAARFQFSIEKSTWSAVCKNAACIKSISPERIFAEINRMLCADHADTALTLLLESGILNEVLPEVAALKGIEQPPEFHPEGDVFTHTVKALSLLNPKPSPILAWSTLLHDIGKPATMTYAGRVRFNNHDHVGAQMATSILRRLKASNNLIEGVEACIGNHMNFINVTKMRLSTLKKFLSRTTLQDELELHRSDCLASHGDIGNYVFLKQKLQELPVESIKPPPLVSGKDLLNLGLKPGPLFGTILSEIYDLQLEEKIFNKEEGVEIVRQRWC